MLGGKSVKHGEDGATYRARPSLSSSRSISLLRRRLQQSLLRNRRQQLSRSYLRRLTRPTGGNRRRDISFAIGIASMVVSFSAGFERWAYEIGRLHHTHRDRMDLRRG